MKGGEALGRAAISKPLYGQVREMLLGRIGRGEWGPGDSLPNEFVLANQFDVSVGTIRRAIEGLEESGIVVRKQGRGTYVSGQGANALQNRFTLLRGATGRPLHLTYKLLGVERRPMTVGERARLVADEGDEAVVVRQTVHTSARTIGVEQSVLPAMLFPSLASSLTTGQYLYAVFSENGVLVTRAEERICATAADAATAEQITVAAGQPVFVVERLAYALDPRPVEFRTSTYVAAEIALHATV